MRRARAFNRGDGLRRPGPCSGGLSPHRAHVLLIGALAFAAPSTAAAQTHPHVHHLAPTPSTVVFGYYSAGLQPVLRMASGDTLVVRTLHTASPELLERAGLPPDEVEQPLRDIWTEVKDRGPGGHVLTGPVYVEGAEPGDVLEVKFLAIDLPIDYGLQSCGGFERSLCSGVGPRIFRLDRKRMTSDFGHGVTIPLRPFFGSIGVAPPPDSGRLSSNPPGTHGGNMDNRELVAGTTLYLPVHAPGALLEIGDGHAAQGDGEVAQTAIETSLVGRLKLTVRKDMHLDWPRAETPTDWIAMGMDPDLTKATHICVEQAAKLLEERGIPVGEAYRLVSLGVSLRITELVDGNVGVHAMIPKALFEGRSR